MKAKRDKKSMKKRKRAKALFIILLIFLACFSVFFIVKHIDIPDISSLAVLNDHAKLKCEEFKENVLWSSGFTHNNMGSTAYYTWKPENWCDETIDKNCFLQKIIVNSRTIYISDNDKKISGKIYIQISNLDNAGCNNPGEGVYGDYLSYEQLEGIEGIENKWYCGYEKEDSEKLIELNPDCRLTNKLVSTSECFGIKAHASQLMMIDVFKIKYTLCQEQE